MISVSIGGGYYWWSANSASRLQAVKLAQKEGQQFGQLHTGEECFKMALSRGDSCKSMSCLFALDDFLIESLKMKPRRDDLCKGIYDTKGVTKIMSWELHICSDYGRADRLCSNLAKAALNYCIDTDTTKP